MYWSFKCSGSFALKASLCSEILWFWGSKRKLLSSRRFLEATLHLGLRKRRLPGSWDVRRLRRANIDLKVNWALIIIYFCRERACFASWKLQKSLLMGMKHFWIAGIWKRDANVTMRSRKIRNNGWNHIYISLRLLIYMSISKFQLDLHMGLILKWNCP